VCYKYGYTLQRTKENYYEGTGVCEIHFDINPKSGLGIISVASDDGYGIYSFVIGDTTSLRLINFEKYCTAEVIAMSDKTIWKDFFSTVKVKSFVSDSIISFRDTTVIYPNMVNDIIALNDNSLLLKYDDRWIICDPVSFKPRSIYKPREENSFNKIWNSQSKECIYFYTTYLEGSTRKGASLKYSFSIHRYWFRENMLEGIISIKDGSLSHCSVDQKNIMHIYYVSFENGTEEDKWIYRYMAYDVSSMKKIKESQQNTTFEYYRVW